MKIHNEVEQGKSVAMRPPRPFAKIGCMNITRRIGFGKSTGYINRRIQLPLN